MDYEEKPGQLGPSVGQAAVDWGEPWKGVRRLWWGSTRASPENLWNLVEEAILHVGSAPKKPPSETLETHPMPPEDLPELGSSPCLLSLALKRAGLKVSEN
jgi:hypothetical protein